MATIRYCFYCIFLFCSINCKNISDVSLVPTAGAQTTKEDKFKKDSIFFEKKEEIANEKPSVKPKLSLSDVYLSQVGVMEKTGNNDGKSVEMYLRSVGLKKGFAWCAAFVRWSYDSSGVKTNINGMALSAVNKANYVYKNGKFIKEPQQGDAVTFYYTNLGRIGHTGFYHERINDKIYMSVEGNTGNTGANNDGIVREGDGVYKKYRSFKSTYNISRWTK